MRVRSILPWLLLLGFSAPAFAGDPRTERAWRAKCAACHGDDGKGQTEQGKKMGIRDMTGAEWQKSVTDDAMRKAINEGVKRDVGGKKQEMEAFAGKLRPDQVDALVVYVRGLGNK
jgi:mono/diheme cytochrome c family protein